MKQKNPYACVQKATQLHPLNDDWEETNKAKFDAKGFDLSEGQLEGKIGIVWKQPCWRYTSEIQHRYRKIALFERRYRYIF